MNTTLATRSILSASLLCALAPAVRAQGGGLPQTSGGAIRRIQTSKGDGAGDGWGSATLSLPADPARIGSTRYTQWLVLDGSPGRRFASSDAVEWTMF